MSLPSNERNSLAASNTETRVSPFYQSQIRNKMQLLNHLWPKLGLFWSIPNCIKRLHRPPLYFNVLAAVE